MSSRLIHSQLLIQGGCCCIHVDDTSSDRFLIQHGAPCQVAHALTCHGPASGCRLRRMRFFVLGGLLPHQDDKAYRAGASVIIPLCIPFFHPPQSNVQESFVLLLSLEHAASGSNLTAAHHVIFVHPMNADTLSSAVAYEQQALARVRRVGQLRKEVHVWRDS